MTITQSKTREVMPLSVHVERFEAAVEGKVKVQTLDQAWVKTTWSPSDLSEWHSSPQPCIFEVADPETYGQSVFTDPKSTLDCIGIGNAIGSWNARGEGKYAFGEEWLAADIELMQEQDEYGDDSVSFSYSIFKVKEGYAGIIWDGALETLLKIVGIHSEEKFESCEVWYGE